MPEDDAELRTLANKYLARATELWPDVVAARVLPEHSDEIISRMVDEYKHRHRTGFIHYDRVERYQAMRIALATAYPRFSDPNSDPKSIPDQLLLILARAKEQGYFVPWDLVFADYARSATYGHRQGFSMLVAFIKERKAPLEMIYIDDYHRGSRDEYEWVCLAHFCKNNEIRLVGASDDFTLDGQDWGLRLRMYNLITVAELDYKRQRVRRGMQSAAEEDGPLGKLPLGLTRQVKRDAKGNALYKPNSKPRMKRCIDPVTRKLVLLIFTLYIKKRWSPDRIAKVFNQKRKNHWDGWTETGIRKILVNPAYIGAFIWNRTRREFDPESRKWKLYRNPWQRWGRRFESRLAIIPKAWHVIARKNLEKRPTKPQRCAPTLFSETLVCGDCGRQILLYRSAKDSRAMACLDGMNKLHGCKLSSSKSVRIIELCLLTFLKEHLLTTDRMKVFVALANKHLGREAKRPGIDVTPLKKQEKKLDQEVQRLTSRLARATSEKVQEAIEQGIEKRKAQLEAIRVKIQQTDRRNSPPPPA